MSESKSYFEPATREACLSCFWFEQVDCDDPPCCYCSHFGRTKAPENFDCEKLKKQVLKAQESGYITEYT